MITVLGHRGSNGRNVIARELGLTAVNSESTLRCNQDRFVINWGVSAFPANFVQRQLTFSNSQDAVRNCVNKITTLDLLDRANVRHVDYLVGTENPQLLREWLRTDGKLLARTRIEGADGEGLRVISRPEDIVNARLYTKHFPADVEYRVHVFYGRSILIQQKRKRADAPQGPDVDTIRVSSNGWGFSLHDLDCDRMRYRDRLRDVGIRAIAAVGVNHGAADILVRHLHQNAVDIRVCEVNSAPALETPATIEAWVGAFRDKFEREGIR